MADARLFLLTLATAAAANAAALAFYPAMKWRNGPRRLAWLACSVAVALSPSAVPARTVWRVAAGLVSVALLLKLYDFDRSAARGVRPRFRTFAGLLPNWFWIVLRRPPRCGPQTGDAPTLIVQGTVMSAGIVALVWACRIDWRAAPFLVEHAVKVAALASMMICGSNALAAAWRLCGGCALTPMRNPLAAVTPADFWRRWNRPTQQFLHEYVYRPLGGHREPVAATLATFVVSGLIHEWLFDLCAGRITGWQMLYFTLHGVAVVATANVHPRGPALRRLWTAATLAFGFATTLLLGATLNDILPFYSPRAGH